MIRTPSGNHQPQTYRVAQQSWRRVTSSGLGWVTAIEMHEDVGSVRRHMEVQRCRNVGRPACL